VVSEIEDILDEPETTYHQNGTTDLCDQFSSPTSHDEYMEDLKNVETNGAYDPASLDMDLVLSSAEESPRLPPRYFPETFKEPDEYYKLRNSVQRSYNSTEIEEYQIQLQNDEYINENSSVPNFGLFQINDAKIRDITQTIPN
ncbi:hypothetical protein OnM2_074007, partial [Erysiphe neolycopersici]